MNPEWQNRAVGSPVHLARELVPEFEKTILQLVVDGFQRWQEGGFIRFGDHEDHYTVRLVKCMKEIRRERNLPFLPQYQDVAPSDAMLKGWEDPARAPRIDITVCWDLLTDDAYFSIECKRVALDDLARLYVTKGIGRFVRGYYGAKAETGGMVGYIIRGTPNAVRQRVNGYVKKASAMGPEQTLIPAESIGWFKDVFVSSHPRAAPLKTIRLTHLFFDLTRLAPEPTAGTR